MRTCSGTFEIVDRLAATLASPQRLAGGRAEFREHFGIDGAALRARHLLDAEQCAAGASPLRRGGAVIPELAAADFARPRRGPGPRAPRAAPLNADAQPDPRQRGLQIYDDTSRAA